MASAPPVTAIDLVQFSEIVDNARTDGERGQNTGVVATANDGRPDVALKGSLMVLDADHLAWWERSRAETEAAVRANPHAAVMVRNIVRDRRTLRFYVETYNLAAGTALAFEAVDGLSRVAWSQDVTVDEPIVITTAHEQAGTALHWRLLVVLEEDAQASVWHESSSAADGLVNGVVELVVGQNARLRLVDLQDLEETSWVFGTQRATVGRDGSLDWITLGFGSANGKVFQETQLAGAGAHGSVTGAYATRGRQHIDFDTLQEHAAPDTTSDLAFRGILADRSSAVWRGMIQVDKGAQRTDAFQESRNLLLSKRAHADAIPGLEILANDVRCTHAAAIAQIDRDQLFYLRSHGLGEPAARRLVIEGFLQGLVERLEAGPVREAVGAALERRLAAVLGAS